VIDALEKLARRLGVRVWTGTRVVNVQALRLECDDLEEEQNEEGSVRTSAGLDAAASYAFRLGYTSTSTRQEARTKKGKKADQNDPSDQSQGEGRGSGEHVRGRGSTQLLDCTCLIMATGSSRGGHQLLRALGHSIVPPLPSLFSFKIDDPCLHALAGTATKESQVPPAAPWMLLKLSTLATARPPS
jgi:hypothetical protein